MAHTDDNYEYLKLTARYGKEYDVSTFPFKFKCFTLDSDYFESIRNSLSAPAKSLFEPVPEGTSIFMCDNWDCPMPCTPLSAVTLSCGLKHCFNCCRYYFQEEINHGKVQISCPDPKLKCSAKYDNKIVQYLVSVKSFEKYISNIDKKIIEINETLKKCINPECDLIIRLECNDKGKFNFSSNLSSMIPFTKCANGHHQCFGCGMDEDHSPLPCHLAKLWKDRDSITNYKALKPPISIGSTPCPNASCVGFPLEKCTDEEGNYLHCDECDSVYCCYCGDKWIHEINHECLNPWPKKTSWSSDYETTIEKHLDERLNFFYYYTRFKHIENKSSRKDNIALLDDIEEKLYTLSKEKSIPLRESVFIWNIMNFLLQCRQTIKWTYPFLFFLSIGGQSKSFMINFYKEIQKKLEFGIANLEMLYINPIESLLEPKLKGKLYNSIEKVFISWEAVLSFWPHGFPKARSGELKVSRELRWFKAERVIYDYKEIEDEFIQDMQPTFGGINENSKI